MSELKVACAPEVLPETISELVNNAFAFGKYVSVFAPVE